MSKKDACYHKVKAGTKFSHQRMRAEVLPNAEKLVQKTGVTRHRKAKGGLVTKKFANGQKYKYRTTKIY